MVVVDKTPECKFALRYAARRAQHTQGRVTLLATASPPDFQQWRGVEEIMEDEAHAEAESLLHEAAKTVNELAGILPELVILQGRLTECVSHLLKEDQDISILVGLCFGGFILGMLESVGLSVLHAYGDITYLAIFVSLLIFLSIRPNGLMGKPWG